MSTGKKIFYHFMYAIMFVLLYLVIRTCVSSFINYYYTNVSDRFAEYEGVTISSLTTVPNLLFGNLAVTLFVLFIAFRRGDKKYVTNFDMPMSSYVKCISYGVLLNLVVTLVIALLVSDGTQVSNAATQSIINDDYFPFILTFIGSAIVTPIAEELVYRYGVQHILHEVMPLSLSIIIASAIFGFMHASLIQGIYAGVMAIIFGIIDECYKSVIPSILIHIAINGSSVILSRTELNPIVVLAFVGCMLYTIGMMIKVFEPKENTNGKTIK